MINKLTDSHHLDSVSKFLYPTVDKSLYLTKNDAANLGFPPKYVAHLVKRFRKCTDLV